MPTGNNPDSSRCVLGLKATLAVNRSSSNVYVHETRVHWVAWPQSNSVCSDEWKGHTLRTVVTASESSIQASKGLSRSMKSFLLMTTTWTLPSATQSALRSLPARLAQQCWLMICETFFSSCMAPHSFTFWGMYKGTTCVCGNSVCKDSTYR